MAEEEENVTITINGEKHDYTLKTYMGGGVTFKELPDDTYMLTVTCDGYETYESEEPLYFGEGADEFQEVNVVLACISTPDDDDDGTGEPDDEEEGSVNVTFYCYYDTGNLQSKIGSVNITLKSTTGSYNQTSSTNSDGLVTFTDVPYGTYTYSTTRLGSTYADIPETELVLDETSGEDLQVDVRMYHPDELEDEGGDTTDTIETLTINITVLDESKEAVPDATVTLAGKEDNYLEQLKTDTTGLVTFTNVPYSTYSIIVQCDGYEESVTDITVNSTNNDPRSITVTLTKE